MKRSFKLTTVFNIPLEIDLTWFIVLALVTVSLAVSYFPSAVPGLPPFSHWLMALSAALLLFTSLLAHELAHSLVAERNHIPISSITLFIFGGVARLEKEPSTPLVELKMAAAGPLLSFLLSLFFFTATAVFSYFNLPDFILAVTDYLFILNLVIGIFNLIPGFPLDGGRILRALLWHFSGNLRRATSIASTSGKLFAICLMLVGLLALLGGSAISGLWLIFIGFFLMEAADNSYRQVAMKNFLSGIKVNKIMTRQVITVPPDLPLDRLVDEYFFRFRFSSFPVMANDVILGAITLHAIKEIDRQKWPQVAVREVMLPVNKNMLINKENEIIDAFSFMANNHLGRLLVVENGKLVGILSQRDIIRLFELKEEVDHDA